jgi:predicted alpha/beta-fold hydrolase
VQTLLGFVARRKLHFPLPYEDLVVPSGDGVPLLVRASFQEGAREGRPALVLLHGLGGTDASGYLVSTALLAWARGYHVFRMNMRGAGDSLPLSLRLYNAGLDGDLLAVLERAARETPRVLVAGFSLGASLALLALGRLRDGLPAALRAAAAVSPPLDLKACALALERASNRPYQIYFMRALRAGYRALQSRAPSRFEAGAADRARTVYEFDDLVTAPYGGYRDAPDYYARSSAGPWLAGIRHPTLILAAKDDPMIPVSSLAPFQDSPSTRREILETGGHVGFVAPTEAPGSFWAAERVLGFLDSHKDEAR